MDIIEKGADILKSYNHYEAKAKEDIPIYLARCFSPLTYNSFNFLTNINSSSELWKFADSQQEFRTSYYGSKILKKFSKDELNLIKDISIEYGKLQKVFKRKTNPVGINHQLSSIPTLRILSQLEKKLGNKLAVFEVGGGSGMLGHMCNRKGYRYTNFDITQSFYVYNSTIYNLMYKDSFLDTHNISGDIENNKELYLSKPLSMIPWWHFVNEKFPLPKCDVVVMNHNFFEISKKAITFILTRLSHAIKGRVYLIVSEWGANKFTELDNEYLCWLEKEFDFRIEKFLGDRKINPKGTVLLSFNKGKNDFDQFLVPLSERLHPQYKKRNKFLIKKLLIKYTSGKIKSVFNLILKSLTNKSPKYLGTISPYLISSKEETHKFRMDFNDLEKIIVEIEAEFGKPLYTEDEAFGFYINNKEHA